MGDEPLPQPKALRDCSALIVGGTSGIGLETARQLLAGGARKVAIVGRDEGRGARALEKVPGATFLRGDAGDADDAVRLTAEAEALLDGIDILVCSTAPAVLPDLFQRTLPAEIAKILNQFALPPMHMAAAVLPAMRARRSGVILNVASDAAKAATPGEAVIGAGMAAIVMFSRALALEEKRAGIRVNVLTPSLVSGTETSERILAGGFSARLFEKAGAMAALGVAEASDLAALAVFLAGPQARRITGQAISVNGGISAA